MRKRSSYFEIKYHLCHLFSNVFIIFFSFFRSTDGIHSQTVFNKIYEQTDIFKSVKNFICMNIFLPNFGFLVQRTYYFTSKMQWCCVERELFIKLIFFWQKGKIVQQEDFLRVHLEYLIIDLFFTEKLSQEKWISERVVQMSCVMCLCTVR